MERLFAFQANLLKPIENRFTRSLFTNINWKHRIFGIRGLRGTGKTTMLLQYLKFHNKEKALYVTADHPWFYDHTLLELADDFEKQEGKVLLIDEIHKYPRWSTELKNIYDGYPGLHVIFAASSALQIQKGEGDLSRRVISYELPGMSFREFLEFEMGIVLRKISLKDLLNEPGEFSSPVLKEVRPLPAFKHYLRQGYFPFGTLENSEDFAIKLNQVIGTVLESDLAVIEGYSAANIVKVKKLLGILSESVPFTPNISSLAAKMTLGRDTVNNFLLHLERARILNLVHRQVKGIAALQKPDKIFLENTNFSFALKDRPETGSLGETFFLNQLRNAGHRVTLPDTGDFMVDGKWTFEIGGKHKKDAQVKNKTKNFLALDEIEHPYINRIPLWLFGFFY